MNNIHKEQILDIFYYKRPIKKTGKITYTVRRNILSIYKNISNELKSFIINTFKDDYDNIEEHLEEILYRIKYDIKEIPKCPICGNKVKYNTLYTTHKYDATCGNEICIKKLQEQNRQKAIYKIYGVKNVGQNKEIRKKVIKTCLEKYGVESPLQSNIIKDKIKRTNLKRYGVENPFQSNIIKEKVKQTNLNHYGVEHPLQSNIIRERVKQTCLERYGVEHPLQSNIIQEKAKQTCIKRYGVENPFQSDIIKDKIKKTCLERYEVESPSQSEIIQEKAKQTCLERYGVEYPTQSEIIKEKVKQSNLEKYGVEHNFQSLIIREKAKQTCLERYSVDNFAKTQQWKDYYKLHQNEIKEKEYQTKRKNHTFNTSKQEDECYNILLRYFDVNDIIRQYKSNVYPFACDFYIKSINTYIECNFHWTHNNHLYNKNNIKDLITKCKWKQKAKTSKYYNIALDVWCKRDVNKYNIAMKNNLNYKVFYNTNEFKNWFAHK